LGRKIGEVSSTSLIVIYRTKPYVHLYGVQRTVNQQINNLFFLPKIKHQVFMGSLSDPKMWEISKWQR